MEFKSKLSTSSYRILFVTGTRADFGKLKPLADSAVKAGYKVTFFTTGMHMLEKYGLTKTEVRRLANIEVVEYINYREGDPQDIILAKTITGFSDFIQEYRPSLVVVHGDRIEALACASVCALNYIRCAHVEGGEVSGTIDEQLRHCNTKLATIHLVSSNEAKKRVIQLGDNPDSIYVIGSPELDIHGKASGVTLEEVRQRYDIEDREYGICIFHPVTSEYKTMNDQATALFRALERSGRYFVVILPNNDPGSDKILSVINRLPSKQFRVLPSMRFAYFSELIRNASAIIGNSSMGVREAPFLGVPSLDIGTRQLNRNNAPSIIGCSAQDIKTIEIFFETMWGRKYPKSVSFGKGNAAEKFVTLLSHESFWNRPMQKYFVDD